MKLGVVGLPNVGKSTLLNALLNEEKAIVTDIPGTTRDVIEAKVNLGNITLNLLDTAGIRKTNDVVEQIGVKKSKEQLEKADFVLFVLDGTTALTADEKILIEKAKEMLGYNYFLSGTVVHGFGLGEKMGFQTANLSFDERKALLPKGVYATRVYFEGRKYKGMTNIGVNPTVQSANKLSVETHILGFSQNIYGKEIKIEFLKKIRAEQKFASKEELINQLSTDALLINGYIDSLER